MLAKAPGYTSVASLALALGIGGCTAIFSVVYATLLEPLHYRDPERLVMVWSKPQPDRRAGTSLDAFLEWRDQSTVFDGLQAWFDNDVSLATAERPEQVEAGFVTPGFIQNHGLVMEMGRGFTEEEGRPGNNRVTVLTDGLWRSRFGADPAIVGKQVRIDGTLHTVTGVIAPGPADRMERKLYVPLAFEPQGPHHAFFSLSVMGRLKPGVSLDRANPGRNRLHHALVVAEFALALSLLTGGGLAVHSLLRLTRTDLGFPTERLLTFSLPVPSSRLADHDATRGFYRRLLERIEALPGVTSATVSTGIPVEGTRFGMPFEVVGQPVAEGAERQGAGFNMATPAYFRTFGMGIVSGRAFGEDDREQAPRVAVVNETFVRRYLAGRDPLAQRLRVPFLVAGRQGEETSVEWQIVGVSRDVRNGGPQREAFPEIDVPFWQSPWPSVQVSVRGAVLPATLGADLAAIVRAADPELPVANLRTMDQVVRRQLAGDRFSALLFGGFATVALVLAALGIYGVMSFVVAQRAHELGLRMALGASRRQLLRLVLRQGMAKALAGTAIGVAGSWWVARSMQGLFPGVPSLEPATFAAIVLGLLAAALLACYVPARRAAGVDPLVAMREE